MKKQFDGDEVIIITAMLGFFFFKAQPLGEHTIRTTIQDACRNLNIVGIGTKDVIVTHVLHGTVTTRLLECNREESAIMQRTRHNKIPTLRQ